MVRMVRMVRSLADRTFQLWFALAVAPGDAGVRAARGEAKRRLGDAAGAEADLRSEVNIELNFPPKLRGGSFSAVSTPIFASK